MGKRTEIHCLEKLSNLMYQYVVEIIELHLIKCSNAMNEECSLNNRIQC